MSFRAWLVRRKIKSVFRPPSLKNADPEVRLRHFDKALKGLEKLLPDAPASAVIEPVDEGGIKGEWVTMPGAREDRILFYSHGGGYVWGGPKQYRDLGCRLGAAMKAKVFLLDYRLAPHNKCPAQIEDALAAYDMVRSRYPNSAITMAGDSAGGGLTLAAVHAIRDSDRVSPVAIALISPWLDVTGKSESIVRNADKEVMLDPGGIGVAGMVFRGEMAGDDPRCSPLFGSQNGLPPVLVQVGSEEILLDDSVHFADKVKAAGGDVTLNVWHKMHHVWHFSANIMPEARKAIAEITAFFEPYWESQGGD